MKTVREAQAIILKDAVTLGKETMPMTGALGRVIAEDVFSNRNHPPFDMSAMDGYALRFNDIKGADRKNPVVLDIVDDIKAGAKPVCAVIAGKTSRIMTGAPIPVGADTVVRVEDTDPSPEGTEVRIFVPSPVGSNIRRLGENLKTGDRVLKKGAELGPPEIGILAMVKKKEASVYRKPSVAILSTGDELEGLDEPLDPEKIPDANSYTVMAELQAIGVTARLLGIARDSRSDLEEKLREGLKYDVLVVSGGVSVGHHDFVRPTLEGLGIEMRFWRVALRPGHPFAFGTNGQPAKTLVFALPGNPVSSMVCCEQFIVPALRKMMGARRLFRRTIKARLEEKVADKKGRVHFMRALLENTPEGYLTRLTGSQGSAILMSMVDADGLLVKPFGKDEVEEGSMVTVQTLHGFEFQEDPDIEDNGPHEGHGH
ncbi:MAG: molybdopterin molybdotransferase MoeA [Deltaproteobacteria bacterium]|nr:molybdopterin molybdotransferase MoeA [Deltaproteobacteria bacterium]